MEPGMSIARYFGMLEVLICFLLGSDTPNAQRSAQNRLETATSVKCEFPLYATGTWTNGEPQAEVKTAKLSLGFDSIDTQGGTARNLGRFGNSDIVVRLSQGSLHFMLVGSSGPLYITTVFDKESRAGKLKAVHTRHEYTDVSLPGFTSRPEQYYGECEVEH